MSTLTKNTNTIQTRDGREFQLEVDDALEFGLRLTVTLRRVFNAMYLAYEQTKQGWITDAAILRLAYDFGPGDVTDAMIRVYVSRLRLALKGSEWGIESVPGGSYRLIKVNPGESK